MNLPKSTTFTQSGSLPVLKLFDEFMQYWLGLRVDVSEQLKRNNEIVDEEGNVCPDICQYLHERLVQFATKQQQQVERMASSFQLNIYHRLTYALVAIIDEKIINHNLWDEGDNWIDHLLEKQLFSSSNAGVVLFQHMQDLIDRPEGLVQEEKELAVIYTRVIWLGFRGQYRHNRNCVEILAETQQALLMSANIAPAKIENHHLFEDSYRANINPQVQQRLAPISVWRRYLWIGVFGYLSVSIFIWFLHTYELSDALNSYLYPTQTSQSGAKNEQ